LHPIHKPIRAFIAFSGGGLKFPRANPLLLDSGLNNQQ
jgi:hypothetical protein